MVSMVKISQNFYKNLFHAILNNPINKKMAATKAVKDRGREGGEVGGRYDRGQRFSGVFLGLPFNLSEV